MNGKGKRNNVVNASFVGEENRKINQKPKPRRDVPKKNTTSAKNNTITEAARIKTKTQNKKAEIKKKKPQAIKSVPPKKKNPQPNPPKGAQIKKSISNQTKSQRTRGRQEKKISGSPKNIEIKRRTHIEKKTFRIKKKRNNFRYFGTLFLLFLLIFVIVAGIFALYVTGKIKSGTDDNSQEMSVTLGEEESGEKKTFLSANYYKDGIYYISVEDVDSLFVLTVTGDKKSLKYITDDNNEYISFEIGSRNATVNGQKVLLEGVCFSSGGKLYVPASFFRNYVKGISYSFDKDKGINLKKIENGKDREGNATYQKLEFLLKQNNTIPAIPEESISK